MIFDWPSPSSASAMRSASSPCRANSRARVECRRGAFAVAGVERGEPLGNEQEPVVGSTVGVLCPRGAARARTTRRRGRGPRATSAASPARRRTGWRRRRPRRRGRPRAHASASRCPPRSVRPGWPRWRGARGRMPPTACSRSASSRPATASAKRCSRYAMRPRSRAVDVVMTPPGAVGAGSGEGGRPLRGRPTPSLRLAPRARRRQRATPSPRHPLHRLDASTHDKSSGAIALAPKVWQAGATDWRPGWADAINDDHERS